MECPEAISSIVYLYFCFELCHSPCLFSDHGGYAVCSNADSDKFVIQPYDQKFNTHDLPKGPPFSNKRPGRLSFNVGPYRFRQNVYSAKNNKNINEYKFKPGILSFRLGPINFLHVPTNTITFDPCCTIPAAKCHQYLDFSNMSEDGNWWDPFCPCLVTRKNIVMTTLAFCCIALVTWTVVVTAKDPANNNLIKSNVTFIVIEDSKTIANLNLTMKSALTIKKVDEAYNKAIKKVSDKIPSSCSSKDSATLCPTYPFHVDMAANRGISCSKNTLILLNAGYILVALILIIVGSSYGSVAFTSLPIVGGIVACGVGLLLVALLGLVGIIKHHQVMLFFYMCILFGIFLIQFSVACASLAVGPEAEKRFLGKAWEHLNDNSQKSVEIKLQCYTNPSCLTCLEVIEPMLNKAFNSVGTIGLFFSFIELIGIYSTYKYRVQIRDMAELSF
ncbi:TSPAN13_31 [Lepeophtheirus salmonis]|uniref:TSPAN13_31 n=1 Tax=Lepeophtheirus salmonis TaxID=72036 RepID=A0A7R8HBS5_LEPSM|nr:TSPAN13_31 [Lepeophtheirus salmonis]CAF2977051.1 TSPAN13_31 [Lepeophtheirus salmonis]